MPYGTTRPQWVNGTSGSDNDITNDNDHDSNVGYVSDKTE